MGTGSESPNWGNNLTKEKKKKTSGYLRAESAGRYSFLQSSGSAQLCWLVTDTSHNLALQPLRHQACAPNQKSLSSKPAPSHTGFFGFVSGGGTVLEKHSLQLRLSWRMSPSVAQFCPQEVMCTPAPLSTPHQRPVRRGPAWRQGKGAILAPCGLSPVPEHRGNNNGDQRAT